MTNERYRNPGSTTGTTDSHPVGVAVGGVTGGAAAGAIAGTMFGPIGTLIGAGIGVVAGAAVGRGVADRIDEEGENEYWRNEYQTRPYAKHEYDFDRDYSSAYSYGLRAREQMGTRTFDEAENELRDGWEQSRGESRLDWDEARPAIRDAFNRADRTYKTYAESDRHFESRFGESTYAGQDETFEDYRPAYRYGVLARTRHGNRDWDEDLDRELSRDWDRHRGSSTLSWESARPGVREAFTSPFIDYNSPYDDTPDYDKSGRANEGIFRVR
ncbi:MAG: glycine zipper family protein [Pseudomonadota bacterium]|nr:glycine zipper family protein [Pseudomonadota bacterium]